MEAANNLPEFEFRCQTAKLLLECAQLTQKQPDTNDQCLKAAISVLGSLLAQNDEVVEIWYLTGCAFAARKPPLSDPARFYLDRAMEMLTDVHKALEQEARFGGGDDEELQEQLAENKVQMEDVQSKLAELAPAEADMEE